MPPSHAGYKALILDEQGHGLLQIEIRFHLYSMANVSSTKVSSKLSRSVSHKGIKAFLFFVIERVEFHKE